MQSRKQAVFMTVVVLAAATAFSARAQGYYPPDLVKDPSSLIKTAGDNSPSADPDGALRPPAGDAAANYVVNVVNPVDEAAVFDDNGDVRVRTAVAPPLANGAQVELLVDGLPAAPPSTSLDFPLAGIPEGSHRLQARVIDSTGNVQAVSPSIAFDVWPD
jgi:hypothetical protein